MLDDHPLNAAEVRRNHREIVELLQDILEAQVQAPRRSERQDIDQVLIKKVTVATAGTPVQGPDIPVPTGFATVIRQRRHSGSHSGLVGFSEHAIGNDSERAILNDNEAISVSVSNLEEIWLDAESVPTGGLNFELIVER